MKKTILFILFIVFTNVYSKHLCRAVLISHDNKEKECFVQLPIIVTDKKINIEINGTKQKYESNNIKFMKLFVDEANNDNYEMLIWDKIYDFNQKGEKKEFNKECWQRVINISDKLLYLDSFMTLDVKKVRGKETFIYTDQLQTMKFYMIYHIEKKLSVYVSHGMVGGKIKPFNKQLRRVGEYLFQDCKKIIDEINSDKKKWYFEEVVEVYNNCN